MNFNKFKFLDFDLVVRPMLGIPYRQPAFPVNQDYKAGRRLRLVRLKVRGQPQRKRPQRRGQL